MTPMTQELIRLVQEVEALGAQLETKRLRIREIVAGSIATDRRGRQSLVDGVDFYQGGGTLRVFLKGAFLKKDGTPHARARESNALQLVASLRRPEEGAT